MADVPGGLEKDTKVFTPMLTMRMEGRGGVGAPFSKGILADNPTCQNSSTAGHSTVLLKAPSLTLAENPHSFNMEHHMLWAPWGL